MVKINIIMNCKNMFNKTNFFSLFLLTINVASAKKLKLFI